MYLGLAIVSTLVFYAAAGAILFASAGTTDVPMFRAYLAFSLVLCFVALGLVYLRTPELIQERMKPGEGERDRVTLGVMILLLLASWAIAGLDVGRYHWSDPIPHWLQIVGLVVFAGGFAVVTWAMLTNPYFSSAVRIQEDRGQRVVSGGPYALVRHPGYTGGILFLVGGAVALGSCLAIIPILAILPFLIRRTLLEDRMLQAELPGYSEYAQRVRSRLIPGLW